MDGRMSLNPKQTKFCYEYIAHRFNGTAAYKAAYGDMDDEAAKASASRLLSNANVENFIKELTEKHLTDIGFTANDVIKELAIMGFSNINDFMTFKDDIAVMKSNEEIGIHAKAIQSIGVIPSAENGNRIKFKLYDKKGCLELLGKHMQLFTDKVDLTTDGKEIKGPVVYLPDNGRD